MTFRMFKKKFQVQVQKEPFYHIKIDSNGNHFRV